MFLIQLRGNFMIEATTEIPQHLIYFLTLIKSYESNFSKHSMLQEVNTVEILMLLEIYDRKGLNQIDLAKKFHVTQSNISQTTKKLLAKGFIEKKMDPKNNSKNLLSLTDKGNELCEFLLAMFLDWNNEVIKDIPMEDLISFGETLEKIYANCLNLI